MSAMGSSASRSFPQQLSQVSGISRSGSNPFAKAFPPQFNMVNAIPRNGSSEVIRQHSQISVVSGMPRKERNSRVASCLAVSTLRAELMRAR